MNWFDLLPHDLAKAQIAWEWDARALRAFRAGCGVKRIATVLHVGDGKVTHAIKRAECRDLRRRRSPAEKFCTTLDDMIVIGCFLGEREIGVHGPAALSEQAIETLIRLEQRP